MTQKNDPKADPTTPEEMKALIEKKRQIVDAKYGPGAFDKAVARLNPHRCSRYMDDMIYGISNHFDLKTIPRYFQCLFSEKGKEPVRLYPDAPSFLGVDLLEHAKKESGKK